MVGIEARSTGRVRQQTETPLLYFDHQVDFEGKPYPYKHDLFKNIKHSMLTDTVTYHTFKWSCRIDSLAIDRNRCLLQSLPVHHSSVVASTCALTTRIKLSHSCFWGRYPNKFVLDCTYPSALGPELLVTVCSASRVRGNAVPHAYIRRGTTGASGNPPQSCL